MNVHQILAISTDRKSGHASLLQDDGQRVACTKSAKAFLNELCLKHGSSLQGRLASFRYLLNAHQKGCILVNGRDVFLPTCGSRSDDCVYLNASRIMHVKSISHSTCSVLFDSGEKLQVNVSMHVVKKQMERCGIFLKLLEENGCGE